MVSKVKGLDRLNAKLKALRTQTAAAVRPAVGEAAQLVVNMQKKLVPVDDGDLRDSIHWFFGAGAVGLQKQTNETRAVIMAGGKKAPHARIIEFGARNHPKQPFFFPGYRAMRKRAKAIINKGVKAAVQKAAK